MNNYYSPWLTGFLTCLSSITAFLGAKSGLCRIKVRRGCIGSVAFDGKDHQSPQQLAGESLKLVQETLSSIGGAFLFYGGAFSNNDDAFLSYGGAFSNNDDAFLSSRGALTTSMMLFYPSFRKAA